MLVAQFLAGTLLAAAASLPGNSNPSPEAISVAHRFAPILFHNFSTHPERHAWDFPTAADFDGDRIGNNNEQSRRLGKHALPAVLYYAVPRSRAARHSGPRENAFLRDTLRR